MKVLVTGSDGYIGTVMVQVLMDKGHDVTRLDTGFYREAWFYNGVKYSPEIISKDTRHVRLADLEGFEAVIHLADLSNDPLGQLDENLTYEINYKATVRLARLAKKAGVKRFIYSSSCSIYGIAKKDLVMVGKAIKDESVPETQEINREIKRLGIEKKVTKTGYIKDADLVKMYNQASVTLLPSYYEGFGLPVLESMACGTPVVCSNVASVSEIAGPDAIFCEPGDPKDIAQKIQKVYSLSEKNLESLSRKLIDHAAKFNWEKVARQTINIYKSLSG